MSQHRNEYWARINRALDYIDRHIDHPLSLHEIAEVANFSPFHFHRIFRALVGETLNEFIQRTRIERAAGQLIANPGKSITAIALDCGFSGSSTFARAFRDRFGMSASAWREGGYLQDSNIGKTVRKDWQVFSGEFSYHAPVAASSGGTLKQIWRSTMPDTLTDQIRVETLPDMTVAYVRHIGPYKGDEKLFRGLFDRLMKWAGPRGLVRFPETKFLIAYHDNPEMTDESKLRTSVCITVPADTEVGGEIGKMVLPGGTYAIGHFEIHVDEYQQAWDTICGIWLPDSGYQPEDGPCFEIGLNDPDQHPEHKHIVEICVPVKPL